MSGDGLVEKELEFNAAIISRAPKGCEAWLHRRWLLKQERKVLRGNLGIWDRELKVCKMGAERAKANYYAWVHRRILVEECLGNADVGMLEKELCDGRKFLERNVSDASALHYQREVLGLLLRIKPAVTWAKDECAPKITWAKDECDPEVTRAKDECDPEVIWAKDECDPEATWVRDECESAKRLVDRYPLLQCTTLHFKMCKSLI